MFRVQIINQLTKSETFYGRVADSLPEVWNILAEMESERMAYQANGFQGLPPNHFLRYLEVSEVYVVGEKTRYWLNEDNQFQIMN